MNAAVAEAFGCPGLIYLVLAVSLAGLVRGFAGFGSALVYIPVASQVLEPVWVLITIVTFDFFGPLPLLRRSIREGNPKEIGLLLLGALVALPLGLFLLTRLDPALFRGFVSGFSLIMIAVLLAGWRYRQKLRRAQAIAVGMVSGFMAGFAGLPGPAIILTYMSGPNQPARIRANSILYLYAVDLLMLGVFLTSGLLHRIPVLLGLILVGPYILFSLIGAAIFRPDQERLFRIVAYCLIAASALVGLPVFD